MTEFKGIALIKLPENIPSYNFLESDFGREVLNEYNSAVKSDYRDNPALKILNLDNNVAKGSNSYAIFLMSKLLSKYGLRTANSADAQKIIDNNDNFLRRVYVDLGVVLRSDNGANEYLAKQLAKQAKDRKYKFSNSNPLVFRPSDLELILDGNSPSGLGFKVSARNPFALADGWIALYIYF